MGDRNLIGCCIVCDAECFEVAAVWTDGPYRGEIKQIGQPLPGARRVTVVRASGRQTDWTVCGECILSPELMPVLNKKELGAMDKERDVIGASEINTKMLRLFEWDIPVGVLGEMPWTEVR